MISGDFGLICLGYLRYRQFDRGLGKDCRQVWSRCQWVWYYGCFDVNL